MSTEANSSADNPVQGVAGYLGEIMNWGLTNQKPKTIAEADALSRKLIGRWCALTAGVSWVPGSTFVLMGMDYKIYHDVAKIYGVKAFNIDAVQASIIATIAGRGLSEGLSFVIGIGWVVKAGLAAGITKAIGEVVMEFMREQSNLPK